MDSLFNVTAIDSSDGTLWAEFTLNNRDDAYGVYEYGKKTIPQLDWSVDRLYNCDKEYALHHIHLLRDELFESALGTGEY
jgi:hypothetical protein